MHPLIRLARPALAPTAAADVLVGYALLIPALASRPRSQALAAAALGLLAACSMLLYAAGMVLNDFFDLKADRRAADPNQRRRPIAAGMVSPRAAVALAMLLVGAGLASAMGVDAITGGATVYWAGMLFFAVLLYNAGLKTWALPGAIALGMCRMINMQMGMAAHGPFNAWFGGLLADGRLRLEMVDVVAPPVILGAYAAVLTWVSTCEERGLDRARAVAVGAVWLGVLAAAAVWAPGKLPAARAALLIGVITLIAWRGAGAWRGLDGAAVRRVTSAGILGIPVLDMVFMLGLGHHAETIPLWPITVAVGAAVLWTFGIWLKRSLT